MFLKSFLVLVTKASRSVWSWLLSVSSAVGYPYLKEHCNYHEIGQVFKRVSFPESQKRPYGWLGYMPHIQNSAATPEHDQYLNDAIQWKQ
ncbi:hypothetical protein DER44DRAFT_216821 [Fusarium oxysporum]|nr:hypothetical protein DER44DRAFT_216821 [Fusarium oxysporum]